VGLATLLSTRTLYAGLLWGLLTLVFTILLGRFFCGWICPFGTLHQLVGFLGRRKRPNSEKIRLNQYRPLQNIKYWILTFLLTISILELAMGFIRLPGTNPLIFGVLALGLLAFMICFAARQARPSLKRTGFLFLLFVGAWLLLNGLLTGRETSMASLQIGLLDPISLITRSINLVILPLLDRTALSVSIIPRAYEGTALIAAMFLTAVLLNLAVPRFYCRSSVRQAHCSAF
jgi:hypothetical protein